MKRVDRVVYRVGISGWRYAGWRGLFYPKGLAARSELEYASAAFNSIEINGTHYALQRPCTFESWREQTPAGFVFSIKGSRYITHFKKLRGVELALANFFASGVLALREKLGPFLWQLPPNLSFEPERMEKFLQQLPRDTEAAVELGRQHDERVEGQVWLQGGKKRKLRHCLEVRHPSFLSAEFFRLLRREKIGFVFADTAGRWPYAEEITADFIYVRLHGFGELYAGSYSDRALDWWAARLRHWAKGESVPDARLITRSRQRAIREIYVYFDNDIKGMAPGDAVRLRERLT